MVTALGARPPPLIYRRGALWVAESCRRRAANGETAPRDYNSRRAPRRREDGATPAERGRGGAAGGSAGPGVCSKPGVGLGLGAGSWVLSRGGGVRIELWHRAGGGRGVGQRCRGAAGYTGRDKRRENPAGRNKSPVNAGLGGGWEGPNSGGMTPKESLALECKGLRFCEMIYTRCFRFWGNAVIGRAEPFAENGQLYGSGVNQLFCRTAQNFESSEFYLVTSSVRASGIGVLLILKPVYWLTTQLKAEQPALIKNK